MKNITLEEVRKIIKKAVVCDCIITLNDSHECWLEEDTFKTSYMIVNHRNKITFNITNGDFMLQEYTYGEKSFVIEGHFKKAEVSNDGSIVTLWFVDNDDKDYEYDYQLSVLTKTDVTKML